LSYERLREERNTLATFSESVQTLVETDPHAAMMLDNEGFIIQINSAFQHLYHQLYKKRIKVGQNFFKKGKNQISDIIESYIFVDKDKCELVELADGFYEICSTLIEDLEHMDKNILILIHDISNFMQLDRMQKRMISTVSHELRNPISVIDMAINNLKKYGDNLSEFQKKELIEMMAKNSNILVQMTEDLTIYTRKKIGTKELNWEEIKLLNLIEEILFQMKLLISKKSIQCKLDIDNEIKIYGDHIRISQILRIFIDNAIKYSQENSEIIISARKYYEGKYNIKKFQEGVIIEVKDNGIGIKKEDIPLLFDPYFRGENAKNIKGTGLGLPIAKELVSIYKGDIFVESELGKGTKFIIFLPLIHNIEKISAK
jgi:signal transduction histidine kinase